MRGTSASEKMANKPLVDNGEGKERQCANCIRPYDAVTLLLAVMSTGGFVGFAFLYNSGQDWWQGATLGGGALTGAAAASMFVVRRLKRASIGVTDGRDGSPEQGDSTTCDQNKP